MIRAEGGCAVALLIFFTIAMLAGAYSVEAWATSILLSVGWMAIAWIRCKATQNKVNAVGGATFTLIIEAKVLERAGKKQKYEKQRAKFVGSMDADNYRLISKFGSSISGYGRR